VTDHIYNSYSEYERKNLSELFVSLYAQKMVEFKEVPNSNDLFIILSPVLSRSIIVDDVYGRPDIYLPAQLRALAEIEYHTMTVVKDGLLLSCEAFNSGITHRFHVVLAMSSKHKPLFNQSFEMGIGVHDGTGVYDKYTRLFLFELLQVETLNHNEKISGYKKRFTLLKTGNSLAATKPKTFEELGLDSVFDEFSTTSKENEEMSRDDMLNLFGMFSVLLHLSHDDFLKMLQGD